MSPDTATNLPLSQRSQLRVTFDLFRRLPPELRLLIRERSVLNAYLTEWRADESERPSPISKSKGKTNAEPEEFFSNRRVHAGMARFLLDPLVPEPVDGKGLKDFLPAYRALHTKYDPMSGEWSLDKPLPITIYPDSKLIEQFVRSDPLLPDPLNHDDQPRDIHLDLGVLPQVLLCTERTMEESTPVLLDVIAMIRPSHLTFTIGRGTKAYHDMIQRLLHESQLSLDPSTGKRTVTMISQSQVEMSGQTTTFEQRLEQTKGRGSDRHFNFVYAPIEDSTSSKSPDHIPLNSFHPLSRGASNAVAMMGDASVTIVGAELMDTSGRGQDSYREFLGRFWVMRGDGSAVSRISLQSLQDWQKDPRARGYQGALLDDPDAESDDGFVF